jgi:hypothetical protein
MSGDGSRLICSRHVYDQDLNHIIDLGEEIHATTCDGKIAHGEPSIFITDTGTVIDKARFAGFNGHVCACISQALAPLDLKNRP